jgi:hypothetical protein
MPTITLNSTNIIRNGNNQLLYVFQNGGAKFTNNDIALANFTIYYSWFNISQQDYRNANFSYIWFDGLTYQVSIPDGQYSIAQINAYLQSVMVSNAHYLIEVSTGKFIYFLQFEENPSFYAVQFNAYLSFLPSTVPTLYTYPVVQPYPWTLPAIPITPQISLFLNTLSTFNNVIGFNENQNYPPTPSLFQYSHISDFSPEVEPVSALNILCSFISNPYSPFKILYSTGIPSVSFGQQINITPPNYLWNKITDGLFQDFTIQITDQNGLPITIKDPQINIVLNIRDRGDNQ